MAQYLAATVASSRPDFSWIKPDDENCKATSAQNFHGEGSSDLRLRTFRASPDSFDGVSANRISAVPLQPSRLVGYIASTVVLNVSPETKAGPEKLIARSLIVMPAPRGKAFLKR